MVRATDTISDPLWQDIIDRDKRITELEKEVASHKQQGELHCQRAAEMHAQLVAAQEAMNDAKCQIAHAMERIKTEYAKLNYARAYERLKTALATDAPALDEHGYPYSQDDMSVSRSDTSDPWSSIPPQMALRAAIREFEFAWDGEAEDCEFYTDSFRSMLDNPDRVRELGAEK